MPLDSTPTVLRELVAQAFSVDVPIAAQGKASLCFADFLSCALEAADLPWSRQAAQLCEGRVGTSPVVGEPFSSFPEDAAFANAVRGHGLVREDMHTGSISHIGVVVWPVLLALAPRAKPNGTQVLKAAVHGYEIGGRIGRVLMTPEVARLFRPTGLIGPFAGALAGAMLLNLDEDQTVSALAFAANSAAGLNQWPHTGADDMYFHPGFAARDAITAIRLARSGARGSEDIIEGKSGLIAAVRRSPLTEKLELYPNDDCEIFSVFNKDVPACNFAQSPCQAALAAVSRLNKGDQIVSIRITTYDAALNYPGCAYLGPFATPLQAKMSIAFGVAATVARGEIAEANYSLLDNAEVLRLISLMEFDVADDLNAAFPAKQGARVTLITDDGNEISEALDDIRFATPARIFERLESSAIERLGKPRAKQLLSSLQDVGGVTHFDKLGDLCRTTSGQTS